MGNTRLLCLPKLRECLADARAFAIASGDRTVAYNIEAAIRCAERHEPPESFKTCPNCNGRHQRELSAFCSYGCAEEDGAIEK